MYARGRDFLVGLFLITLLYCKIVTNLQMSSNGTLATNDNSLEDMIDGVLLGGQDLANDDPGFELEALLELDSPSVGPTLDMRQYDERDYQCMLVLHINICQVLHNHEIVIWINSPSSRKFSSHASTPSHSPQPLPTETGQFHQQS